MKRILSMGLVTSLVIGWIGFSIAQPVSEQLEKAVYLEETVGDLDVAVEMYKKIVAEGSSNREYIARALHRLGCCYLKQGKKEQAKQSLEQLVQQYPEQEKLAQSAKMKLSGFSERSGFLPLFQAVERIVYDDGARKDTFIDFDTGKLYYLTEDLKKHSNPFEAFREMGVDACCETSNRGPGLYGGDMIVLPVVGEAWNNDKLVQGYMNDLKQGTPGSPVILSAKGELPAAYLFKTREGSTGILQILELQNGKSPRFVRIQHKLLEYGTSSISQEQRIEAEEVSAQGWKLWQQRDLEQAEKTFQKALQLDPKHEHAWNGLGWSRFNQGRPQAAKIAFEKCIELNPKHSGALNGLGWIAKGEGHTEEAIRFWNRAIEASPGATASLSGLATTYMEMKQYDEAAKVYEKWLEVEPDNAQVKAGLESARKGNPAVDAANLPVLIKELSNPDAPQFEALNRIIDIGAPAVPMLIKEMQTSDNWQIPKALGAIGDVRAIPPLIDKLEKCNESPMREVVVEALGRLSDKDLGTDAKAWRKWWDSEGAKIKAKSREKEEIQYSNPPSKDEIIQKRKQAMAEGDLIAAIDGEMQRVMLRKLNNNPWMDKIPLAGLYTDYAKQHRPSKQTQEDLEQAIKAYLEQHSTDRDYAWRLYNLLAAQAEDLNQLEKAVTYLDKALDAYPEKDYADPSRYSGFQHLVNHRAELTWRTEGVEAAERFAIERLESDPRFEYFSKIWWEREYKNANLQHRIGPLLEKLKQAYRRRITKFPKRAEYAEAYFRQITAEGEREEALSKGDLIALIDAKMKTIVNMKGNPWKDKNALDGEYESFVKQVQPDADRKQAEVKRVLVYLEKHRGEEDYKWRILHLLSLMTLDLDQKAAAADYLDRALEGYPLSEYPSPASYSKFQHLMNDRAAVLWDMEGVEAAERFIVQQMKTNPRFEYFFDNFWKKQYQKTDQSERLLPLLDKIDAAYGERIQRFPHRKELYEKYRANLSKERQQMATKD